MAHGGREAARAGDAGDDGEESMVANPMAKLDRAVEARLLNGSLPAAIRILRADVLSTYTESMHNDL